MEEKLLELINQVLRQKTKIIDEEYNVVTYEYFKQLPAIGDIIINDCKRYVVVRREFEIDRHSYSYSSFSGDNDCQIIVKKLTSNKD